MVLESTQTTSEKPSAVMGPAIASQTVTVPDISLQSGCNPTLMVPVVCVLSVMIPPSTSTVQLPVTSSVPDDSPVQLLPSPNEERLVGPLTVRHESIANHTPAAISPPQPTTLSHEASGGGTSGVPPAPGAPPVPLSVPPVPLSVPPVPPSKSSSSALKSMQPVRGRAKAVAPTVERKRK